VHRPNSTALLVFANGAVAQLKADSELEIVKFEQAPFEHTLTAAEVPLSSEPSKSITEIDLQNGTLVAGVMKLKTEVDSEFTVSNPGWIVNRPINAIFVSNVKRDKDMRVVAIAMSAIRGHFLLHPYFNPRLSAALQQPDLTIGEPAKVTASLDDPGDFPIRLNFVESVITDVDAQQVLDCFYDAINLVRPNLQKLAAPEPRPSLPIVDEFQFPDHTVPFSFGYPDAFPTPVTRAMPTHP